MQDLLAYLENLWKESVIPTLFEYIRIPNVSPAYAPDWQQQNYMYAATQLLANWAKKVGPKNMQLEILQEENRTPVIFIEIPGEKPGNILFYGHLDKQPAMSGWDEDLGPWLPIIKMDKLYGRGGADDGYSLFAAMTGILSLKHFGIAMPNCSILIEASEESGSPDLPFYMEKLSPRLTSPDLIIALDSGCKTYEQMWSTSSLRGLISADLHISIMQSGLHSDLAGGVVPSPFFILRKLLERLEDSKTGKIIPDFLYEKIPPERIEQAQKSSQYLNIQELKKSFDLHEGAELLTNDYTSAMLKQTWEPALTVVGLSGLPDVPAAGNVLQSKTSARLSLRIPPTLNASIAAKKLHQLLTENPPFNAHIDLQIQQICQGWHAPHCSEKLTHIFNQAAQRYFKSDMLYCGEGGSIPFIAMLGEQYPQAEFLITGVLGPLSNAHGPNEFLHLPYVIKLTATIAEILRLF